MGLKGGGRQPFGASAMQRLMKMMGQAKAGGKGAKGAKVVSKFGKQAQKQQPKALKLAKIDISKHGKKAPLKQLDVKAAGKPKVDEKLLAKLKEVDHSLKMWVGGLAKSTTWKSLRAHLMQASTKPKIVHINERSRNGVVTFAEESQVQEAIDMLNGSELDGSAIECDVWTKPDKADRVDKPKKVKSQLKTEISKHGKAAQKPLKQQNLKAAGKPKVDEKLMAKLKEVDHSLKMWVGGLAKSTTWKSLRAHLMQASTKPKIVHINEKNHKGVVTFAEESQVQEAIDALNGSELDGSAIELDVWTMPERKERKPKA